MFASGHHVFARVLGHIKYDAAPDQRWNGMRAEFGQACDRGDLFFIQAVVIIATFAKVTQTVQL